MKRVWLAVLGLALVFAAYLLIPTPFPSEGREKGKPLSPSNVLEKKEKEEGRKTKPAGREELGQTLLRVSIVDPKGGLLSARMTWIQGSIPPQGPELLMDAPYLKREKDFPLMRRGTVGKAPFAISLPGPMWVWLKLEGKDREGIAFRIFRMVSPFRGTKNLTVHFDPGFRTIHVFLMDLEKKGQLGEQKVQLFEGPATGPGALVRKANGVSNAFGYLAFSGLREKGYLLVGPGATIDDKVPYTARILFPEGIGPSDTLVALAPKGKRRKVRFDLKVSQAFPSLRRPPKIFLRPLDSPLGVRLFSKGVLRKGSNRFEMEVPPGSYETYILPFGVLSFPKNFQRIVVPEDQDLVLKTELISNPDQTQVELEGLLGHQAPFYVYPRFELNPFGVEEEPGFAFLGPFRWHEPKARVALPRRPFRLMVLAAGNCRFSTKLFRPPFPSHLKVSLREGTLVELSVDPQKTPLAMVEGPLEVIVRDSLGTLRHSLKRKIQRIGGVTLVRLRASIVVPKGESVHFQIVRRGKNRVLLEKSFRGEGEMATLTL